MTKTTEPEGRQRTMCPGCGREVSFTTDLVFKYVRLHRRPGSGGRGWCPVRQIEVAA